MEEGGGGEGEIGEFGEVVEFPGIGGGGVFGEFVDAQEGFMGEALERPRRWGWTVRVVP